ncbi:MAG: hypothetical protein MZV64_04435 [Ignavibacteriales bacterium]|nr:hypothetical protein [Ignavibacteriales bacterium]
MQIFPEAENSVEAVQALPLKQKKQEVVFQTINLYYSIVEADQLLKSQRRRCKTTAKKS